MPTNLHTHDLIFRLKKIKDEQGLSTQDVQELLEASGYHVSENSIRKVFAPGSEKQHFRYHDTIEPIARVLLAVYPEDDNNTEKEALRAEISVKDELIDHLKNQIVLKDERIDRLMSRVDVLLQQLQKLFDKCDKCPANRGIDVLKGDNKQ